MTTIETMIEKSSDYQVNNIEHKKLDLIQWITTLDDIDVVCQLGELKTKYFGKQEPLSLEEHLAIMAGFADVEAGRVTPHSQVKATYEKWL